MTHEEFLHVVRSAASIAEVDELLVFGSQAVLVFFPDAPSQLRQSVELDVVPYRNPEVTVVCPDIHDLAASKLAAGRDKDFDYVNVLIAHDYVDTQKLLRRVARLDLPAEDRSRLRAWIGAVAHRLSGKPDATSS